MLKLLSLLIFCTLCLCSNAQPPCGFDIVKERLLKLDTGYAGRIKNDEAKIQQWLKMDARRNGASLVQRVAAITYIPVVVHVLHTGGAVGTIYNPSDANVLGAINYLNQVYAGTAPGMTPPYEGGPIVNMNLQFVMAQRTATCGSTNGIDRVDASSLPNYITNGINASNTNGCPELTLKNFDRWDSTKYYNIWVVNKIDAHDGTSGQFIAGFAYLAAGAPPALDGMVMLATQTKSGVKTLPHEIGHAFNLNHPFNGSNNNTQCPANTDCTTNGDDVCDTDPITNNLNASTGAYSFTCRTGASNTCLNPAAPYTINTESNFMSYTNCYTLFTNGQQARVNAALSLPNRASLASSNGGTQCGPVINFNVATDSTSEANSINNTPPDCRFYKDYTYTINNGSGATATATVTLSFGGTATRGLDYDVTTNGSFTSPSNALIFAAGTSLSHPFTVRVYDDANVETAETIILNFTVNSGGGNAVAGTTTPTLTIGITDNDTEPIAGPNVTKQIGTITPGIGILDAPFDAGNSEQKSQYIYKASELIAQGLTAGNITNLQLVIPDKNTTGSFTNFTVKMTNTSTNYIYDNGNFSPLTGLTTVADSVDFSTQNGWNNFRLSTPFAWDGTSNLGIELCYYGTIGNSGYDGVNSYQDGSTINQVYEIFEGGISCSDNFTNKVNGVAYGGKPVIQLTVDVSATPIESTATATKTQFIGNGSNDYFYSNNNALLIKLANVSADLGCVTASLPAAGNVWVTYSGGVRSAKVYQVTPTINGTGTTYDNSLYFTDAELGGKAASTLKIAKTTATNLANANKSNTILVTPIVTMLGTTTVFTGTFTGFSQFFLVDDLVVLPISLLDFYGKLTPDHNIQLNWVTSQEQNNKSFEVEMSRNGTDFILLGSVASKGNSALPQNYNYLHLKPMPGITYYRLKEIDLDGHFTFSKIIIIDIANNGTVNISLYPVPAHNMVTINFGNIIIKKEIIVYSADMKAVLKQTINSPAITTELDVSSLPNGIYFIKVSDGVTSSLLKFIKQ